MHRIASRPGPPTARELNVARMQTRLLLRAGQLLLEYNESTAAIQRALVTTASALGGSACHVVIYYGSVAVSLDGGSPSQVSVPELRYNTAVQARVHEILAQVCRHQLDMDAAVSLLDTVVAETPQHSRWLVVAVLGAAAASLAGLLGADLGAAAVAGLATALGLIVRQELGRRHVCLLALPLCAAFIGAVLGGLAIRLDWTQAPALALVVPALMVVPGPHLINALLDLIDNYLPMSLARLGLAAGILLASAVGIALGILLLLPQPIAGDHASADHLNLLSDMALAGIVTCGFALFYNTAWRHVGMAVLGGMAGHGIRFLALGAGLQLDAATFFGGLAVGAISAWMAHSYRLPVAVIAFAGAVTMIPGLDMYRALVGGLHLARLADGADVETLARTIGNALHAALVVSGLALGLIVGSRAVEALLRERQPRTGPHRGQHPGTE